MSIKRPLRHANVTDTYVLTSGASYAMTNENVLVCKKTVGSATAVTLPATPPTGRVVTVKDGNGDAATNNITVSAASGNIDGAATHVISENYGSADYHYNGTQWGVVAEGRAVASAELDFLDGVTAGTVAASKAVVVDSAGSIGTLNSVTLNSVVINDLGALAAAGTVIANAAAITQTVSVVSGADDAKGVVLPAATTGKLFIVYSSQSGNGLKLYPPVNGTLNGGSANAALVVEGRTMAICLATNSTNYGVIFTLNT